MMKLVSHWLALLLVLTLLCAGNTAQAQTENARGYETPEACAQAVFDALMAADIAALEDCFCFTEIARQYDYVKYAERLQAIVVAVSLLPATGPLNIAYNEAKLRSDFYRRLAFTTLHLNREGLTAFLDSGTPLPSTDASYAEILRLLGEASTMDCWKNLMLAEVATPEAIPELAEKYYSDLNQKNIAKQSAPWGFTKAVDLLLMLTPSEPDSGADTVRLVMPIQFFQSDGRWLASPLASNAGLIMGLGALDMVMAMSP